MTRSRTSPIHQLRRGRLIAAAAASLAFAGAALGVVMVASPPQGQQVATNPDHAVTEVALVGMTVSDLTRSVEFYKRVLGFDQVGETEVVGPATEHLTGVFGARCRTARLTLGQETIELTQFLAPEGRPIPVDSRSNDLWFQHIAIVVADMESAYAHLRKHNIRHASSGPQRLPDWNPDAGGISAFYFKDPDGHVLEVIHFPQGKGGPRWHEPTDKLFLGIDHTAIVVRDTDRSIAFYTGVLGMKVAGASENHGTEQEHLNNVFGARLRITALRAARGPGIELLEYLSPSDGRPIPPDFRANDLTHWHITLVTPGAEELAARLRQHRVSWVSPGLVSGIEGDLPVAAHIRDPDGHALILGQKAAANKAAKSQ